MSLFHEIPKNEQPFERCERYGPGILSDAELLAIMIRTGTTQADPIQIGQKILQQMGTKGLAGLMTSTYRQLLSVEGIGSVKAIQLLCLGEISKRISRQQAVKKITLSSPASIADYYMESLRHESEEQVWVAVFDSRCHLRTEKMISRGVSNASLVTPREIYRFALEERAFSIVLLHNHPSGDPTPSMDDLDLTQQVLEAGQMIGIPLLDHIIIGDQTYISLKEIGQIP